jgi:hypothetical protein
MNVVDNLNCVYVINKLCMREARCVSLIPRTTLHSDSEHMGWSKTSPVIIEALLEEGAIPDSLSKTTLGGPFLQYLDYIYADKSKVRNTVVYCQ